jgi:glycosyltransferase involved in cell wall biosynthesis
MTVGSSWWICTLPFWMMPTSWQGAPDPVLHTVARAAGSSPGSFANEGAPRAVLEAFAAGVPVIASRLEVVRDGVSGLVLSHREPGEWRAAVERLLDDGEAERLGEGAWRTWRANYGPEMGLQALEAAYREAMDAS